MKKLVLLVLFEIPIMLFCQATNENTVEVLGNTFSVGDTLIFTAGSMPNGEFMSAVYVNTLLAPATYSLNSDALPHLPSQFINYKFIIEKIKIIKSKDGLNSTTVLVISHKKSQVWVNVVTAITKKEILFKNSITNEK